VPVGDVGAGSFDAYEGIRIVIPGAIAVTVSSTAYQAITLSHSSPISDSTGGSIAAALLFGLMLYFVDIPAKAAAYEKEQPTAYVATKFASDKLSRAEVINKYFVLLDTIMPATIRNRSLYVGSMYRIGLELILLASGSTYAVFAAVVAHGRVMARSVHPLLFSGAGAMLAVLVIGFYGNLRYARTQAARRNKQAPAVLEIAKPIVGDLSRRWWLLFILGLVTELLSLGLPGSSKFLIPSGLAICFVVWTLKYVRGATSDGVRKPLEPVGAAILYSVPLACAWIAIGRMHLSILYTDARATVWMAGTLGTLVLILSRGHERKLHGGYYSQRNWCDLNAETVRRYLSGDELGTEDLPSPS
jgi:hypothetical protein